MRTTFSIRDDRVAWSGSGDEVVLLDLATSTYLAVNEAAAALWQRLSEGSATSTELGDVLVAQFPDLARSQADEDASEFLADLSARGFVSRSDVEDSGLSNDV